MSPLGEEVFPCNDLAKECLPSTSPCYQGVVEQAGRTVVLHRRKPKPRGNSSLPKAPERVLASMSLVSWSLTLLTVLRV